MEVIKYKYPQSIGLKSLAIALGYFDGVHIGHRELISLLVREARSMGLRPFIFTFADTISKTKNTQSIIYNSNEKLRIFETLGVEGVIIADFSSISGLSPEVFVKDVLIDAIGAELAISGYNFRFGKFASAGSKELIELMEKNNKRALILSEKRFNGNILSATAIRTLMSEKKMEEANKMLGHPYFIEEKVERGLGLGKAYGFPTVNLPIRLDSPLPTGVYRCATMIDGKAYTVITNVGRCPTIKEREIHAEAMIADFDGNLYDKSIRIYFLGYLREEKVFNSVDELREQIYTDKEKSIKENGDLKWLETGPSLL